MLVRKKFFLILTTLHLVFYAGAAFYISGVAPNENAKKTEAVATALVKNLNHLIFENSDFVQELIYKFYRGELSAKDLLASLTTLHVSTVEVVNKEANAPLFQGAISSNVPQEFVESERSLHIYKSPNEQRGEQAGAGIHFSTKMSIKMKDGNFRAHIVTYRFPARWMRQWKKFYKFEYFILNIDSSGTHLLQSSRPLENSTDFLRSTARSITDQRQPLNIGPLPPFKTTLLKDEHFLLPYILQTTESSSLVIVYSFPTADYFIDSKVENLLALAAFFLLSLLITCATYYLSRP